MELRGIRTPDPHTASMDVAAVIAALGDHFTAEEGAIAEQPLRQYEGAVPDAQLIQEVGLASVDAQLLQPGGLEDRGVGFPSSAARC